ncbi:MAG: hypothetical protein PHO91_01160 [Patescibacteria group bacterium]|nr:hypothetical protein [Patescibacteria group bacterium]
MALKYHKIFNHDHLNAREISEVYMSAPTDRGRLFVISELPKHKIDQGPYIDAIVNKSANYFESSPQENTEVLLEEILQELNQLLPELAADIKIRNWLGTLDLALGIIDNDDIFIASIGKINGLLIQNNQLVPILEKSNAINPTKIFSDIVSGRLDEGDALIISTDSLFDYISKEKIRQLVRKYSPSAAAIKINELLESVPEFVTFNSLLIKKSDLREQEISPQEIETAREEREEKVALRTSEEILVKKESRPRTRLSLDVKAAKNISGLKKIIGFFQLLFLCGKYIGLILAYVFKQLKKLLLFIFSAPYRRKKEKETLEEIKEITEKKYNWWQALSLAKKISLIMLFVFVLAFIQSLVFLTQDKDIKNRAEAYQEALTMIEMKYEEVEAKLIYKDEPGAEKTLLEIEQIIDNLKAASPQQQAEINSLKENLFYKLNRVRRIHVVASPLSLFDLGEIKNTLSLEQKNGLFYLLADQGIYLLGEDKPELIYSLPDDQIALSMTDWPDTNRIILESSSLSGEKSLQIFDLTNKRLLGNVRLAPENQNFRDLAIYNNNLYTLDQLAKQIFRYGASGQNFGTGQRWLTENYDLSQANSLAIDGSIYILENSGQIKNFLRGRSNEFNYHLPHPEIGPNSLIKTFRESDYLYIADPQNQRIIIMDKNGTIKDQYTSQSFDKLTDLTIDPEEKAVYLLNGQQIFILAIN